METFPKAEHTGLKPVGQNQVRIFAVYVAY